ncbi:MAG: hypothetical protein ACO23N_04020 [Opitutales bacterium]
MSHHLPTVVLLAAAAAAPASWIPDSPILRIGEDVDVYFTAKARLDYNSNIFLGSAAGLPNQGTSWTVGPGLSADFSKEANFSSSFSYRRDFVRYLDSSLRGLDDDQDVAGASFTYDGGGPLTFQAEASYQEDARNTTDTIFVDPLSLAPEFEGTLTRQTVYSQSVTASYRITDKFSTSLAANHRSNRYDPFERKLSPGVFNTDRLTEADSWSYPINFRYQVTSRLNIGATYEHENTDITAARGASVAPTYTGFTKDFYGLTFSGQPTESGKLDVNIRAGLLRTAYDGGVGPSTSASYSVGLTHTLTEKFNHALNFSDDANIAVNGRRSERLSINYLVNYVASEEFRASAFIGYSTSEIETTATVNTGSFGINATYSPDSHWTYVASYTLTQAYNPSPYNISQFSLEANLRW